MSVVTNTIQLRGNPDDIFSRVTTAKYWTQWHPATVGVKGQIQRPMRLGDVIRERAKIGAAIAESDWTVTEWERNWRVVLSMPATRLGDLKITYSFAPIPDGTEYTRTLEFDASLLPEQARAAIVSQMQSDSQTAVARIKEMIEHPVVSPDGVSIDFRVFGQGEPLLVLSGGPGLSSDYVLPIAETLSNQFQTILPDQRGTGGTQLAELTLESLALSRYIADLEALRSSRGIQRWAILGHSWGGMLAMAYSTLHADRVSQMILVGTGGMTLDFAPSMSERIRERMSDADKAAAEYWQEKIERGEDMPKAHVEHLRALMPGYLQDRRFVEQAMDGMKSFEGVNEQTIASLESEEYDLHAGLRQTGVPTLLVHGRCDPIPASVVEDIAATMPNARQLWLEACGHFPWIEQPELFYSYVRTFLADGELIAQPGNQTVAAVG